MKRVIDALFKNVAETADNHPYPELRSRYYKGTKKQVIQAINDVLLGQEWEVIHTDEERGEFSIIRRSPILRATSDIVITLYGASPVKWSVDVRSASRSGLGDLGNNRKYILQFYSQLNKKIAPISS